MCYHRSCVVTEDEKVWFHPRSDHHTDIRKLHHIREEGFHATMGQVALECVPVHSLFDFAGWELKLDQPCKPNWYDTTIEKKVLDKIASDVLRKMNRDSRSYGGGDELMLPHLRQIDNGTYLTAEQVLMLGGQHYPVRGCVFKAETIVIDENLGKRNFPSPPFEGCTFITNRLVDRSSGVGIDRFNDIVTPERRRRNPYDERYLGIHSRPMQVGIDLASGPYIQAYQQWIKP